MIHTDTQTREYRNQLHNLTFLLRTEDKDKCPMRSPTHKSLQFLLRGGFNEPAGADHIPGTHLDCRVCRPRDCGCCCRCCCCCCETESTVKHILCSGIQLTPFRKEEVKKLIILAEGERERERARERERERELFV